MGSARVGKSGQDEVALVVEVQSHEIPLVSRLDIEALRDLLGRTGAVSLATDGRGRPAVLTLRLVP